jgi:hypothetical protein
MRPRKSEQYPFSYFVATFMAHLRAMHRSPRVGPFTSSVHRIATACITAEQSLVSSRRSEPAVTKVDVVDVIGIQEGCQSWNNATSVSAVPLSGRATSKARGKSFKRCWRILQSFLNGQECRQRPNFATEPPFDPRFHTPVVPYRLFFSIVTHTSSQPKIRWAKHHASSPVCPKRQSDSSEGKTSHTLHVDVRFSIPPNHTLF